jgi:hypothetical protein
MKRALLPLICALSSGLLLAGISEAEMSYCDGTPESCLIFAPGWSYETKVIDDAYFYDVSVVQLADGRYRLYGGPDVDHYSASQHAVWSYESPDGLNFTKDAGSRIESGAFLPFAVRLPDGRIRLYYCDTSDPNTLSPIKSAVSATAEGLNFTIEAGNRLAPSGQGYETGPLQDPRVIRLPDDTYRMYYTAMEGTEQDSLERILSAHSTDGLNFTRDDGVRLYPRDLCPGETSFNHFTAFIGPTGMYHLYFAGGTCGQDYWNTQSGITDARSEDGLNFTVDTSGLNNPIIEGYFKDPQESIFESPYAAPYDPAIVVLDEGIRLYFGVYQGPLVIEESGIYCAISYSVDDPTPLIVKADNTDPDADGDTLALTATIDAIATPFLPIVRFRLPDGRMLYYTKAGKLSGKPTPFLPGGPFVLKKSITDRVIATITYGSIPEGTYILESGAVDVTQTTSARNLVYVGTTATQEIRAAAPDDDEDDIDDDSDDLD